MNQASIIAVELAALYQRDLLRMQQEIAAFPDDAAVWQTVPGVSNSAGNLILHLEGNLREYIGRQLGSVAFERDRPREFAAKGLTREDLSARVAALVVLLPPIIAALTPADFARAYPLEVFGKPLSTSQFVIHLHGHFNWHLGQIDYLRRVLTGSGAIATARI